MPAHSPARTYFGWQPERVNFLFGLTGRRAALVGAGCVAGIFPFAISAPASGVVWWPVAGVLLAVALVRVHGITIDEWITAAASYQLGRLHSRHKFLGGPATPGHVPVMSLAQRSWRSSKPRNADLPGVLAPQRILLGEYAGEPLGVVHHRLDRTYTAVAKVRFPGIGLVDTSRQQQRVDGWASVLAGLCTQDSPIVRVQAMQRLLPASGAALRRWHADHLSEDAPEAAVAVTDQLLSGATLATAQRDAYLSFTLDVRKAGSAIKAAGGGDRGAMTVLARQARVITSSLSGADLSVESWLSPRDLSEVIRTAYDPHAGRHLSDRRAAHGQGQGLEPGVHPGVAGPAAAEAQPGAYVHDGAKSVTYWVYDWPRARVYATALAPLLGEGHHRRAVSLHIEPLGPREAERQVMRERTSRDVAVRMRQRTGQVVPEHERAALERAEAQDAERAAGHGLARFCGFVTCTVTDDADLEDACAELEADAAAARIEIRRMWFAQDVGFASSALPLGIGLPKKRW